MITFNSNNIAIVKVRDRSKITHPCKTTIRKLFKDAHVGNNPNYASYQVMCVRCKKIFRESYLSLTTLDKMYEDHVNFIEL